MQENYKFEVIEDFSEKTEITKGIFVELDFHKGEILNKRAMTNWVYKMLEKGYIRKVEQE